MASNCKNLYLGIEISTQQAKVIAIDDNLSITYEDSLNFDQELAEYKTEGGVHKDKENDKIVTAPTLMWVKALDTILQRMKEAGFPFRSVAAVSGTAQQHGSVYWSQCARNLLKELQSDKPMEPQLKKCFSVENSPVWMDASTTEQCRDLEEAMGGPLAVSKITGSRAQERFTGNQIAKLYKYNETVYKATERISLVSSLICTLFFGDYSPIDLSDGSGMNLLDIHNHVWDQQFLDYTAPGLGAKLGYPIPSSQCVGFVSSYMQDRYGFLPECKLIAFTGDNPASLAGMVLQKGDAIVTLGTSDVVVLWTNEAVPDIYANTLVNPIDPRAYMVMNVYKNGSLTREKVRDVFANRSWDDFDKLIRGTAPGNNGNVSFWYDVQEITPFVRGIYKFNAQDEAVDSFTPAEEIRALIEGQFMAKRIHSENLGFIRTPATRILATGGASKNRAILQVLADVFDCCVYTLDVANSAVLGSAYRAKHGLLNGTFNAWRDIVATAPKLECTVMPNRVAVKIYDELIERYKALEKGIITAQ